MRVYNIGTAKRTYVKPGRHKEGDPAEWYEEVIEDDGKVKRRPIQFQVFFDARGIARLGSQDGPEVPDSLGRFMVDEGQAQKSSLITRAAGLVMA